MTSTPSDSIPTTRRTRWWRVAVAALALAAMSALGLATAGPAAAEVVEGPQFAFTAGCDQYFGPGWVEWDIVDPEGEAYHNVVTIVDGEGEVVYEQVYVGATEFEGSTEVGPGDYVISYIASGETNPRHVENQPFTIACPELDVELVDVTCSTGTSGATSGLVTGRLTGLIPGQSYDWFFAKSTASLTVLATGTLVAESDTADVPQKNLLPGNYLFYAQWSGEGGVYDWRAFGIDPCQPTIAVTVEQCTASGGTGSATVALSQLVRGVAYTVTGPDGSTQEVVGDGSGSASFAYAGLVAGTTATVTVEGTWTVDEPFEEPPFIGGGDYVPLDTVELFASADVVLETCPAAAAVPMLAASGGGDPTIPIVAGSLLVAIGAAAVMIARRRSERESGETSTR